MPSSLKERIRRQMLAVGRVLGATGISPNALTLLGLLLNCVAAAIIASGALLVGGIAFLIASAFDMLDGAVARAMGSSSRFGAFLDSVVDRLSDASLFVAVLFLAASQRDVTLALGGGLALIGSFMVSYTRARAEGLGLDCEIGWFQRPERVIAGGVGLIVAEWVPMALGFMVWALAIVTTFTMVQRIRYVQNLLARG
jgi:CDP-diacylglycerol---glycerol-3-phosphate 3-phosphatidyltransferase